MNFLVPKETLEAILQYLGQQPYVGVANLIGAIAKCELDPKDAEEAKKELDKKEAALKGKVVDIKKKVVKKVAKKEKKAKTDGMPPCPTT